MNQIQEKIERLEALNRERDGLYLELKRSLAIEELCPDAFKEGNPRSQVYGNPRGDLTFTITLANGERHDFPLEDIPVILWSEQVKADIRQLGPFHARKYHTILTGEDNAQKP